MADEKIDIRKVRDFGDNLNDTFSFIRLNLKPLLVGVGGVAGVFMLAYAICNGVYQSRASSVLTRLFSGAYHMGTADGMPVESIFTRTYLLLMLLGWANYVAMNLSVTCFIKLYDVKNGEAPTLNEVWDEFKRHFFKVYVSTIPIAIVVLIGLAFCLVPGVYLGVVLAPFMIVLAVEDESFGGAWNRCFNIIKDNFWPSLGLYFLLYLICGIAAGIISMLVGLVFGTASYLTTNDVGTTIGIVMSVLSVFSYLFYIVFYISLNLNYYNLAERHDGTGIMRKLDTFGQAGDYNNTPEDY